MATEYINKFSFAKYLDSHYCDRCKAIFFINDVDFHPRFCWSCRIKDVMNDLETYQTEDVKEQKHGKWMEIRQGVIPSGYCSECEIWNRVTAYCPNCGAQMEIGDSDVLRTD